MVNKNIVTKRGMVIQSLALQAPEVHEMSSSTQPKGYLQGGQGLPYL